MTAEVHPTGYGAYCADCGWGHEYGDEESAILDAEEHNKSHRRAGE